MKLSIEISDVSVSNLLFGHMGTCSDWLHSIEGNLTKVHAQFDTETDLEGDNSGRAVIKATGIARGLSLMAEGNPYQFGQWLDGNADDVTFDVAWQFIIFGREIYG